MRDNRRCVADPGIPAPQSRPCQGSDGRFESSRLTLNFLMEIRAIGAFRGRTLLTFWSTVKCTHYLSSTGKLGAATARSGVSVSALQLNEDATRALRHARRGKPIGSSCRWPHAGHNVDRPHPRDRGRSIASHKTGRSTFPRNRDLCCCVPLLQTRSRLPTIPDEPKPRRRICARTKTSSVVWPGVLEVRRNGPPQAGTTSRSMFRLHAGRFGDRPRRASPFRSFGLHIRRSGPGIGRSRPSDLRAEPDIRRRRFAPPRTISRATCLWSRGPPTQQSGSMGLVPHSTVRKTAAPRAPDEVSIPWNDGQMRSINDTTLLPAATGWDFATDLISAAASLRRPMARLEARQP